MADTICSSCGGWEGRATTILRLRFREAAAYQQTIQHPNMPSAVFPFGIYIQGKEVKWQKRLFSPFGKKGNLKALAESGPIGGLEQGTFVRPPPAGAGPGPLPHRQTLPRELGLMGKGAGLGVGRGGDPCASPGAPRTPASSGPRRAPGPQPQLDHSPQINQSIQPRPAPAEVSAGRT